MVLGWATHWTTLLQHYCSLENCHDKLLLGSSAAAVWCSGLKVTDEHKKQTKMQRLLACLPISYMSTPSLLRSVPEAMRGSAPPALGDLVSRIDPSWRM